MRLHQRGHIAAANIWGRLTARCAARYAKHVEALNLAVTVAPAQQDGWLVVSPSAPRLH